MAEHTDKQVLQSIPSTGIIATGSHVQPEKDKPVVEQLLRETSTSPDPSATKLEIDRVTDSVQVAKEPSVITAAPGKMSDAIASLATNIMEALHQAANEPETRSKSSTDTLLYLLKYLDVDPTLPPTAPIGCPHLVDLDGHAADDCEYSNLRMADAVASVLYKYDKQALYAFMDQPNYNYFEYVLKNPDGPGAAVMRRGAYVVVSSDSLHTRRPSPEPSRLIG
jgi:hypothetical protein